MRADVGKLGGVAARVATEVGEAPDAVLHHSNFVDVLLGEGDDDGKAVPLKDDLTVVVAVARNVAESQNSLLLNFQLLRLQQTQERIDRTCSHHDGCLHHY